MRKLGIGQAPSRRDVIPKVLAIMLVYMLQ